MTKHSDNTKTDTCNNNVLGNVIYPQLEDIRLACSMIANGIDDLTPILSKEEIEQFKLLASKWMFNLQKHKADVINGMINELSL